MRKIASPLWALFAGCAGCATPSDIGGSQLIDAHEDFAIHYAKATPAWSVTAHDLNRLPGQADLQRWRQGHVGGMVATVGSGLGTEAPQHFPMLLRSMTWVAQLEKAYPKDIALARSPKDVRTAWRNGRIALIPGLEGADQIDGNIENIRTLYRLGLRSLLIVYDHNNIFGDGANAFANSAGLRRPAHGGLTDQGRELVREANRLGLLVDLSHAAEPTALQALKVARAPVIFSHSGAQALADTPRNLSDQVLRQLRRNGGMVMVSMVPYLTTTAHWKWFDAGEKEYARLRAEHGKGPALQAGMKSWDEKNPEPKVSVNDVADQIEYVARFVGRDHVGLGSDFDGMGDIVITDLSDASTFPLLLAEMRRRGWTKAELEGLSARNFLRTWSVVQSRSKT